MSPKFLHLLKSLEEYLILLVLLFWINEQEIERTRGLLKLLIPLAVFGDFCSILIRSIGRLFKSIWMFSSKCKGFRIRIVNIQEIIDNWFVMYFRMKLRAQRLLKELQYAW